MNLPRLRHFRFWCQSVLPLVYDDSLSYYEVLCKVVKYINDLIDSDRQIIDSVEELEKELAIVQKWIDDFDPTIIRKVVDEYLITGVFFGLTDSGYFVAYIPDSWDEITFNTTQYDYFELPSLNFGHLVLSY